MCYFIVCLLQIRPEEPPFGTPLRVLNAPKPPCNVAHHLSFLREATCRCGTSCYIMSSTATSRAVEYIFALSLSIVSGPMLLTIGGLFFLGTCVRIP